MVTLFMLKTLFRLKCCERKTLFRLKKEAEQAGFLVSRTAPMGIQPIKKQYVTLFAFWLLPFWLNSSTHLANCFLSLRLNDD